MDLRHLRYFSAVAATGGFGRAAAVLNLAQPALSRQIRDLEQELGVRLLERTSRGVHLTAAGELFHEASGRVLDALQEALGAVHAVSSGASGQCRLGVGPVPLTIQSITTMLGRLPDIVPGIAIDVQMADGIRQLERLQSGALDIGIVAQSGLFPPDIETETLLRSDFDCALLGVTHPLATRALIEPDDLADEPAAFLSPSRAPGLVDAATSAFARAGIRSRREFHYTSPNSVIMVVAAGRGWAPVPGLARGRPPDGTVVIPVRGLRFPFEVMLTWRSGELRQPARAVLEAIRTLRQEPPADLPAAATPAPAAPLPARPATTRPALPPGLEIRHLRYFASVADEGSFGRAAERLGLTQPALSRQVADLERHVGSELLVRTSRGVSLSDAGRALRDGAERVLATLEELAGAMERARRGLVGRCVLGSVLSGATAPTLRRLEETCRSRWPALELILEEYETTAQPDAVREGDIDIGLCWAFHELRGDPAVVHEQLVDDAIVGALVAKDHPLAGRRELAPADLAGVPFLFMRRPHQPDYYDRTVAELRALDFDLMLEDQYDSLHVVGALVAAGRGWTLGPRSFAHRPPPGITMVPVAGMHLAWGVDILYRRRESNPAVLKVLIALREMRDGPPPAPPAAPARARRARRASRKAPSAS